MICTSSQDRLLPEANKSQAPASVLADIDRLLNPKSLEELEALERQINSKLQSDEPIDVEYWEQLLCNVSVYKSKAELNAVYRTIIDSQLNDLRQEQRAEASSLKGKLALLIHESVDASCHQIKPISHSQEIDPEPSLKVRSEDKALEIIDEKEFLKMSVSQMLCIRICPSCTNDDIVVSRKGKGHQIEICTFAASSCRQTSSSSVYKASRSTCAKCWPVRTRRQ